MAAYPGPNPKPDTTGPIVHCPMVLPITAGCDTAWNRTKVCGDAYSIERLCLKPLCHSGAPKPKQHEGGLFLDILIGMFILLKYCRCLSVCSPTASTSAVCLVLRGTLYSAVHCILYIVALI
jgi:hypothetical protein